MNHILEHRIANNYEEYLEICKETCTQETKNTTFSDDKEVPLEFDEWTHFFGISEFLDEKYDEIDDADELIRNFEGDMELKPEEHEYPVLVSYHFVDHYDRYGDTTSQLWDWTSLSKLGLIQK